MLPYFYCPYLYYRQNNYQAYAPPFFWGPWVNVGSHAGEVYYAIAYEEIGDVLAKGRIQYWDYDTKNQVIKEFWREINIHTSDSYGNILVSFQSLGPTGVTVNVEASPYSPPVPPQIPAEPAVQQQESCGQFLDTKWSFDYCINIGYSSSGKPVIRITKMQPVETYAWQYLISSITEAEVIYNKEYKRLDIKGRMNVKGKKNNFNKYFDEADGKNKVMVSPEREINTVLLFQAFFENVELPVAAGSKKHPVQATFAYNGTVVDKPTTFVVRG